jgi:hypothetical protein
LEPGSGIETPIPAKTWKVLLAKLPAEVGWGARVIKTSVPEI